MYIECRWLWHAAFSMLMLFSSSARAQFAVIDVASVTQLISQARTLADQLASARAQLAQTQAQYQAMVGNRGMQMLLSGTVRNYLPSDWQQLSAVIQGGSSYGGLAAALQQSLSANAVLTPPQLSLLAPDVRSQIDSARSSVALLQGLAQTALANASGRFAAIQKLVDAIPSAQDQKGILDLQARIGAEQGMLQNEQNKLQVLFESALAEEWAAQQRARELSLAGQGRFATRFEPVAP